MAMAPDGRYSLAPAPGCSTLMRRFHSWLSQARWVSFPEFLTVRSLRFRDPIGEQQQPVSGI
jgi:hypothetical protein